MGNPVPSQIRSVDPYASYDSNVVNKLTRMISDGNNILLSPSPIDVSLTNTTTIKALEGKAIMQDVLIEIQDLPIDLSDIDFYLDSSGGIWNETGFYLVVLHYEYQKTSPPPEASIKIILPSQKATLFDPTKHLFLKCLEVTGSFEATALHDYDPDNPALNRDDLITGASAGNFVSTDKDTIDLGESLYNVGSSTTDRFNTMWVRNLKVENIEYTSPPGSAVYGSAIYGSGTYGDLAEKYTCDPTKILEVGTVIEMTLDDEYEVGQCDSDLSSFVMGIISDDPAYILNSHLKNAAVVGLVGRIPTKVIGPVKKKDIMVSAGNGCLRAATSPLEYYAKVGIALENNNDTSVKLVNCFIK
jgi:hypothetical protein